jgi:hypothetical protein
MLALIEHSRNFILFYLKKAIDGEIFDFSHLQHHHLVVNSLTMFRIICGAIELMMEIIVDVQELENARCSGGRV